MARPRKRPADARTHRIPVQFTAREAATVRAKAARTNRPVAAYLRDLALAQVPRARPSATSDDAAIRVLAHIGTTLRSLQADGIVAPNSPAAALLTTTLEEVLDAIRALADPPTTRPISAATERCLEGSA